jgi:hypothetical protein
MSSAARKIFRIQYVSDLHLEFYDKLAFPLVVKPVARYLALAGDIGKPGYPLFTSFLQYVSHNWDRVFYVPGNHEYYAHKEPKHWKYHAPTTLFETQELLKKACAPFKNIHFLCHDNPSVYLSEENVAIIGSTLWTHIPDTHCMEAKYGMNDYRLISMIADDSHIRALNPEDTNIMHEKERSMLESQITYWGLQRTHACVITHHMPSLSLISPRYESNPLNCCFASSCESLMKPHVRAWIYGHTHNSSVHIIGKTQCVVNARGYPNENVPGFSNDTWLEFPIGDDGDTPIENDELCASAVGIRPPLILKENTLDEEIMFV